MEADDLEAQAEHLAGALGGKAAALDVRVEAPADLALAARDAPETEHELTDVPAGRLVHRDENERVAIGIEVVLLQPLLELGLRLVAIHRLPGRYRHTSSRLNRSWIAVEIAFLVLPEDEALREERERQGDHPRTIPGGIPRLSA